MAQQVKTEPVVATKPAPIANPAPLGLCAFALTTFVLSVINAGFIDAVFTPIVIGLAFFYGGIAQLLAGMWEFRTGNTFGSTAFTSYGAFWLSYAAILIPGFAIVDRLGKNPHPALGLYLLGWTIFTAIMTAGALRINGALSAVFVALLITFACLTVAELTGNTFWQHLGGWLGILTAVLAWYTAAAAVMEHATGGAIKLPVYPYKPAIA